MKSILTNILYLISLCGSFKFVGIYFPLTLPLLIFFNKFKSKDIILLLIFLLSLLVYANNFEGVVKAFIFTIGPLFYITIKNIGNLPSSYCLIGIILVIFDLFLGSLSGENYGYGYRLNPLIINEVSHTSQIILILSIMIFLNRNSVKEFAVLSFLNVAITQTLTSLISLYLTFFVKINTIKTCLKYFYISISAVAFLSIVGLLSYIEILPRLISIQNLFYLDQQQNIISATQSIFGRRISSALTGLLTYIEIGKQGLVSTSHLNQSSIDSIYLTMYQEIPYNQKLVEQGINLSIQGYLSELIFETGLIPAFFVLFLISYDLKLNHLNVYLFSLGLFCLLFYSTTANPLAWFLTYAAQQKSFNIDHRNN